MSLLNCGLRPSTSLRTGIADCGIKNRYVRVFDRLKAQGEIGFIPFTVAGDPDLATSERILRAYIDGGADILEIGYPFSDPVADGPVNQRAAQRAIAAGLDHSSFFALITRVRSMSDIPIGILMYANSALHLGYDAFCKRAADAGIDSLLIADMPPEEADEVSSCMRKYGLGRVYIVSELTPPERMRFICSQVDSFVYVVSRLGATGIDKTLSGSIASTLSRLKRVTDKPLAVGFGLSAPEHIKAMRTAGADAAIVGSALVSVIEANCDKRKELPRILAKKIAVYKAATR
jgi:tryptophan synthase alpha chain